MLFASIDIGSNAVRLYFANVIENNDTVVIEKASLVRIPIRLGEDVFNGGFITDKKRKDFIQTTTAFKMLIDVYKPISYMACATSAMREASNGNEIIQEVKKKAGLEIRIIDGEEEANILSTLDSMAGQDKCKHTMLVDVGGGSTEISIAQNHKRIISESFRLGTLRILYKKDTPDEWLRMKNFTSYLSSTYPDFCLLGSGGNINKLAKLFGHYESHTLSRKNLQKAYVQIKQTPLKVRIEKMGMRPDRADVIEPAARIFLAIMENTKSKSIFVPKIGLTDGLIYLQFKQYKNRMCF